MRSVITLLCALSFIFLTALLALNYRTIIKNIPKDSVRDVCRILFAASMAAGIVCAGLFIGLVKNMRKENLAHAKQLGQVQYMLDVEKKLFDAYRKPELFVEALRQVAVTMTAEQTYFMILDNAVITRLYRWNKEKGEDSGVLEEIYVEEVFPFLTKRTRESGSQIYYNLEKLKGTIDYGNLKKHGIKNFIFTPVQDSDQKTVGILGSANMRRLWENAERLECVALSFGMALSNHNTFEKLTKMGMSDGLTGLLNRNSFQQASRTYGSGTFENLTCIFVDADGLHELNNHLGHAAGDTMLVEVAKNLKKYFRCQDVYRTGGDEFLVVCKNMEEKDVKFSLDTACRAIEEGGYHVSAGMEWREDSFSVDDMVHVAEAKMYEEKHRYYAGKGDVKRAREMNHILESILSEKRDADAFLAVLSSNFTGVYFLNLNTDSIRNIYMPEYFKKMLKKTEGKFSMALKNYIHVMVAPKDQDKMERLLDYEKLSEALEKGIRPEVEYEKKDGSHILVRIYRSEDYSEGKKEMIWLFQNVKTGI